MQATEPSGMHLLHALRQSHASWFVTGFLPMNRLMSAMTSGAKFKLLGFIKGLFQKPGAESAPIEEPAVNELPPTQDPEPATPKPVRNGHGQDNGGRAPQRGSAS